jgi:aspartate aminotransferase-like enzyme
VGVVQALDVALGLIEEEGLDTVFDRHRVLGRAARAAAHGLELELFGPEDEDANVCTAIELPEGIDGAKVPSTMRKRYGVTIAGGQGKLKGQICRIAHCGYFGAFDIIVAVGALEMTLRDLGHEVELGAGVSAAQRVFQDAGVSLGASA